MRMGFYLVELGICDVPGASGFPEALDPLARVLRRCVAPFPSFVEDVGEESLFPVGPDC